MSLGMQAYTCQHAKALNETVYQDAASVCVCAQIRLVRDKGWAWARDARVRVLHASDSLIRDERRRIESCAREG